MIDKLPKSVLIWELYFFIGNFEEFCGLRCLSKACREVVDRCMRDLKLNYPQIRRELLVMQKHARDIFQVELRVAKANRPFERIQAFKSKSDFSELTSLHDISNATGNILKAIQGLYILFESKEVVPSWKAIRCKLNPRIFRNYIENLSVLPIDKRIRSLVRFIYKSIKDDSLKRENFPAYKIYTFVISILKYEDLMQDFANSRISLHYLNNMIKEYEAYSSPHR